MAQAQAVRRRSGASRVSRLWWRTTVWARRHVIFTDGFALVLLSLGVVTVGVLSVENNRVVPVSALGVVLVLGGLLLSVRSLWLLFAVAAATVALILTRAGRDVPAGSVIVVAVVAVLVLPVARSRGRLGLQGFRGDSMLVDLRDRLRAHGELPALPDGWSAEVVLRSAGGASFSGDFLVASRSGDRVEIALVDVSGKGVPAGTRALLLSGAFGGLLGSLPPEDFLPAANRYLLRQGWEEGFATVGHLVLDLSTGEYVVSVAGHPPAVHFTAGSGRWRLGEASEGPLLGVFPDAAFVAERGCLQRGDALLMFTDGLIESPGKDISVGIDKLLGEAERLVTRGFRHGARRLLDRVASAHNDDRAVVLIWRD
jgi:hypothetical protein